MPGEESLRPKWPLHRTVESGKASLDLIKTYKERLEPRLPAEFGQTLAENVATLEEQATVRGVNHTRQLASTRNQRGIAREAVEYIGAVRRAIRRTSNDPAVRKDFGVGELVRPSSVTSVCTAVLTIIGAAEKHPEAFANAGLLPTDVEEGRTLHDALTSADNSQESAKVTARLTTTERDRARVAVENGIDRLVAAAVLEFRDDPDILARFRALIPARRRKACAPSPEPTDAA